MLTGGGLPVYVVTDRHLVDEGRLPAVCAAAARGGAWAVQVRERDLPAADLLSLVRAVVAAVREVAGETVPVLVNDRVDVALAAPADGVHLPERGLPVREARRLLGDRALVGASAHSPAAAAAAAAAGADFVVFGHVFETASKAGLPPRGLAELAAVCAVASVPVLAIGGIGPERVPAVLAAGAAGVAVRGAVMAAPDPVAAVRALRQA
ncbi:MAG: thiamine phosphate synthase, partial [Clostridia bacterium]|nr:thiamine phosphate synthase [Clostridia bacterium]